MYHHWWGVGLEKIGENMKYLLLAIIVVVGLNSCASKSGVSEKEYYRSNHASEKALDKLDRE